MLAWPIPYKFSYWLSLHLSFSLALKVFQRCTLWQGSQKQWHNPRFLTNQKINQDLAYADLRVSEVIKSSLKSSGSWRDGMDEVGPCRGLSYIQGTNSPDSSCLEQVEQYGPPGSSRCQLGKMGTPWLLKWLITTSRTTALGRTSVKAETWCYSGSFRALSLPTNKPSTSPLKGIRRKQNLCLKRKKENLACSNQYLEFLQLKKMNYLQLTKISRKYLSLLSRNLST